MAQRAADPVTPAPSSSSAHPPHAERSLWAPLETAQYRRLFVSAVVVVAGVMAQAVARGWLAYELTGSNTGLGGVMLAFGGAMLVATPWGGVAADRLPKRAVLIGAIATLFASSLWMGLAVAFDFIHYWMLVVAGAMQAAAFAFFLPSRIALTVELVEHHDVASAVALNQMSQEGVRVLSPAIAGVLIGIPLVGVRGVFLIAAASSLFAAQVAWRLPRTRRERPAQRRSAWSDIVDGVRYVRHRRGLRLVVLSTIVLIVVTFPFNTLLPTVATEQLHVGASAYGVMSAAVGAGALLAGFLWRSRNAPLPRRARVMAIGAGTMGIGLVALGLSPWFSSALIALVAVGAGGLVLQTASQSLVLSMADFEYHGRMQSIVVLGFSGHGLAALPLGVLADATSVGTTLVLIGVIATILAAAFGVVAPRHVRTAESSLT